MSKYKMNKTHCKKGFTPHHFQGGKLGLNFKKFKSGAGFTLVESTIAILILMIGIVAIGQFFPFALRIIGDSQNQTVASNAALSKLEEIISQNYDSVSTGTIEVKQKISTDATHYLYKFERETVVETVDSSLNPSGTDIGLKKITVTVYWASPITRAEKTLSVNSLISDF